MNPNRSKTAAEPGPEGVNWVEIVRRHVGSMRQGAVEIVIHDGRVVEIKKSERVRFGGEDSAAGGGSSGVEGGKP